MDIEKSFSYPFEDTEVGSKLGLGAAIGLIPILNFAWTGYMVDIIRNVMSDTPRPLPNWDDFGRKLVDGLIIIVAFLIYALPIIILLCLPLTALVGSGILSANSDMENIARTLEGVSGILFACIFGLSMLYMLGLSVIQPAIMVVFAREGTFASCFKLREAFNLISRNAGAFFTAWGVGLALNFGVLLVVAFINIILSIIPCLGGLLGMGFSIVAYTYVVAVYAHLFGQFAREAFGQTQLVPVG